MALGAPTEKTQGQAGRSGGSRSLPETLRGSDRELAASQLLQNPGPH